MILSKYGKSYDTGNGSEQQHPGSMREARGNGQADRQRWEDDGGSVDVAPPALVIAGELALKPGWSVLSLCDLNDVIRQAHDPVRLQAEQVERTRRQMNHALRAHDDEVVRAARAEGARYRNDWEHILQPVRKAPATHE